jgi:hypothetical protein
MSVQAPHWPRRRGRRAAALLAMATAACQADIGSPRVQAQADGAVDDGDAATPDGCVTPFFRDHDGDGHGGAEAIVACAAPSGSVPVGDDCNDQSRFVHPGASEFCDGVDDDCDGQIDEAGCPANADGAFALGTPYLRLRLSTSWSEAAQRCTAAGMRLAHIEAPDEHDALWTVAGNQTTFFGATDQGQEGSWRWAGTGELFWSGGSAGTPVVGLYSNWQPGIEPNNSGGAEHCAAFWAPHGGRWADEPCDADHNAVCEAF